MSVAIAVEVTAAGREMPQTTMMIKMVVGEGSGEGAPYPKREARREATTNTTREARRTSGIETVLRESRLGTMTVARTGRERKEVLDHIETGTVAMTEVDTTVIGAGKHLHALCVCLKSQYPFMW